MSEETRSLILMSAQKLFGSKGYDATSIRDIAKDAHVTKGAIYHYFGSKHELLIATARFMASSAHEPVCSSDDHGGGLAAVLAAELDDAVRNEKFWTSLTALGLDSEVAPTRLTKALALLDSDVMPGADPGIAAMLLRGACVAAARHLTTSEDRERTRQLLLDALCMLAGVSHPPVVRVLPGDDNG